jgi:hypothetical protein
MVIILPTPLPPLSVVSPPPINYIFDEINMNYFSAISPRIRPQTAAHRSRRWAASHLPTPDNTST